MGYLEPDVFFTDELIMRTGFFTMPFISSGVGGHKGNNFKDIYLFANNLFKAHPGGQIH